ncbi:MAG: hypothetical protein ACRD19_02230 [Terriglobia bacterium]
MNKITRLVLWLCQKFTHSDLEALVEQLREVLAGHEPEIHTAMTFASSILTTVIFTSIPKRLSLSRPTSLPESPSWTGGSCAPTTSALTLAASRR